MWQTLHMSFIGSMQSCSVFMVLYLSIPFNFPSISGVQGYNKILFVLLLFSLRVIYFLFVSVYIFPPNTDLGPAGRVFWYFRHGNDRIFLIIDGHGHFGSSVLIVHHDGSVYTLIVIHKLRGLSLFS